MSYPGDYDRVLRLSRADPRDVAAFLDRLDAHHRALHAELGRHPSHAAWLDRSALDVGVLRDYFGDRDDGRHQILSAELAGDPGADSFWHHRMPLHVTHDGDDYEVGTGYRREWDPIGHRYQNYEPSMVYLGWFPRATTDDDIPASYRSGFLAHIDADTARAAVDHLPEPVAGHFREHLRAHGLGHLWPDADAVESDPTH